MKTSNALISSFIPPRDPGGHKGTFGKVYCLCGSDTMFGAAILSVSAALRSGAGLCTIGGSNELCSRVVSARPETVAHVFTPSDDCVSMLAQQMNRCSAVVIGSGLGVQNRPLVRKLVPHITVPMVIDADGIRALTEGDFSWEQISAPFLITPHLGEMEAVCGLSPAQIQNDRVGCAAETAKQIGGIVLLKGPGTLITDGDILYENTTGSDAIATPGSGDVLGGLIAGLTAQGAPLLEAAAAGAYLHGRAGDLAAEALTPYCVIASDILTYLPGAFRSVLYPHP